MKGVLKATTPFPNVLLDEVMPRLKDTEWRLLCVIVRQTLGWQEHGSQHRKEKDWLSRDQLKRRTGRNNEALSVGLDALVHGGYITARNSKSQLLSTPGARRKNHGRIYYGLSNEWKLKHLGNEHSKSEHNKTPQGLSASSIFITKGSKTELASNVIPNTTKETTTKENVTKEAPSGSVREFISLFQNLASHYALEQSNIVPSRIETVRLETLLAKHNLPDWTPLLHMFFESDLNYIIRRDYSLPAFLQTCNIFLVHRNSIVARQSPGYNKRRT